MDDHQHVTPEAEKRLDLQPNRQRFFLKLGVGFAVGICLVAGVVALFRYRQRGGQVGQVKGTAVEAQPTITTAPTLEAKVPASLDGLLVAPELASRRPLAIMIENHVDARPQFGLREASVVYEAIAEGGITRFMALFGASESEKVGPVRSARTYYLDWALEYDAGYAHVGGNIDALDLIPEIGIKDLDQFALGTRAFRRESRAGIALEHTMYTDTGKLRAIAGEKFGSEQNWTKPTFQVAPAREHRPAGQTITINFSAPAFRVDWTYDPETNTYLRSLGGSLHKDPASGETLRAATIFVQEVARKPTITRINEQGLTMTTVGSGKAFVFRDGKRIEATWKKESRTAPTVFTDLEGQPIARNTGPAWFEIVHADTPVTSEEITAPPTT